MIQTGEIKVEHLTKSFLVSKRSGGILSAAKQLVYRKHEEIRALDGVSFHIQPGELVGYIGPNGAGKSTTVKVMSGILTPTSGSCLVSGLIPFRQRIAHVKNIGVVFGQRSQLWWDVPVADSFDLLKDIYRIEKHAYLATREDLVHSLQLEDLLDIPVRQLSLGQRMRCELAASLLHRPPVVFLDEPTIGLDAISKLAVRQFIQRINTSLNTTVILTTHDMDDIEALCSRVLVIGKGRLLFDGSIAKLRKLVSEERRMIVDYSRPYERPELPDTSLLEQKGQRVVYGFSPDRVKASELIKFASTHFEVDDVLVQNAAIEEIIADLYRTLNL